MITQDMTLLQIAETGEGAIEVLHRYDQPAGTCLLCTHLFDWISWKYWLR